MLRMKSAQRFGSTQQTKPFRLASPYSPAGDQGKVIDGVVEGFISGEREQTIMGVTGSGKTYMMASVVEKIQKPTLVIAHNKTLAAQLAEEFKRFFPDNAVHYFVSYYDYYQPESYIPRSDTFIEKQTQINEEIERLRNATTQALLTRKDVLIVASVSCIYGIGNPEDFESLKIDFQVGQQYRLDTIARRLIDLQFNRTNLDLKRGMFRMRGDTLEFIPSNEEVGYRLNFFGNELESIQSFEIVTGNAIEEMEAYSVYPARQYVTTQEKIKSSIDHIQEDLAKQVEYFEKQGLLLPAERLKQRTQADIEMLQTLGYCSGIENYSVYFDGRQDGEPPSTLIDYFPPDSITFIDESHITLPQISAMYNGDRSRKNTLVQYGFRLPSALNNRPLKIDEFYTKINQTVYVSATPGDFEQGLTNKIGKNKLSFELQHRPKKKTPIPVHQAIIRPTGLLDPEIILKPVENQVDDVLEQVRQRVANGQRVLITTLTKKFAEELDIYFKQINVKSAYIHSDVETLDRLDILSDLRRGRYDVLIGINLLREGLDLPEVSLVAIFDADKEGFLRSRTSLIQIIGRAARHTEGKVIMYADRVTQSMQFAIDETERRRELQMAYNLKHGITPKNATRELKSIADDVREQIEAEEKLEETSKIGAVFTPAGWAAADEVEFEVESRYKRGKRMAGRGTSQSVHTEQRQVRERQTGKQVYDAFDKEKDRILDEMRQGDFSLAELKERLQISIDAMNFEEAAAIRDLISEKVSGSS